MSEDGAINPKAREIVLGTIRRSLGVNGQERPRRDAVSERMARHVVGITPERATRQGEERLALFKAMVEGSAATFERIPDSMAVPKAVADYLRARNLPSRVRMGTDPRLDRLPWDKTSLDIERGRAAGEDQAGVSHAFGAAAETGTLVMISGPDNPTTINFLPDHHLVVVDVRDIAGDYETVWTQLRARFGEGLMPRAVNWVTGPSRSADIEQKLLYGAHGPRSLHVMVVG